MWFYVANNLYKNYLTKKKKNYKKILEILMVISNVLSHMKGNNITRDRENVGRTS